MGEETVEVLIIGGGITGVTVGRLLQLGGMDDFTILEKASGAGGLCRSSDVRGHVLDIGGGHLLSSKYPEVYEFIFSHLPKSEFNTFDRVSKIALNGDVLDYPIEYNLWQLPLEKRIEYLISCVQASDSTSDKTPLNFEQWVRRRLGDAIADNYMIPYNRKIWGVEPNELATDWLEKIPRHDVVQIVRSCLDHKDFKVAFPSHQTFMYPRRGGFQTLFDAILRPVQAHVRLSTPLTSLRRVDDYWVVNEKYRAGLVINTVPWSIVHSVNTNGPAIDDHLSRLQTSALAVTLHEGPYDGDTQWMYISDPALAHHREFYIQNFVPHSAPNGIFRETNARHFRSAPDALSTHLNEHAYPIPVRGHSEAAQAVWSAYAELGVIGVGRWGQHRYYNSDVCIREAMRLISEYLKGGGRAAADAMTTVGSQVLT